MLGEKQAQARGPIELRAGPAALRRCLGPAQQAAAQRDSLLRLTQQGRQARHCARAQRAQKSDQSPVTVAGS